MRIQIKLYATLRQYIPDSADLTCKEGLEVAEGTTVIQIMEMLHLPEKFNVLAMVNGRHCADQKEMLHEGDSLLFYPLITGG